MRKFQAMGLGLVGAGLLFAVSGCGNATGKPSVSTSMTRAKVGGTVYVQGKLATNVRVTFDPSNSERKSVAAVSAETDKTGHYELETLTGKNLVIVTALKRGAGGPMPQMVDVSEGDNAIEIHVPPGS